MNVASEFHLRETLVTFTSSFKTTAARMTRRGAFATLAGIAAASLLGSPLSQAQARTLKIGYILAQDSQLGAGASAFAKELAAATQGRLTVEQFPNSALGGEVEMLKGVQLGTIDLAFITGAPLPNIIPEVGVFNIPFLFRDAAHAHAVLDCLSAKPIWKDSAARTWWHWRGARTACATSPIPSRRSRIRVTSRA